MKLISFTVRRYRSITEAVKIETNDLTVCLGPNNEGKSNILRALTAAMHVLTKGGPRANRTGNTRRYGYDRSSFDWDRDFPHHLRNNKKKDSEVTLEFGLTDREVEVFREEIGNRLNGSLPLKFSFGREDTTVAVVKQGRGARSLNAKAGRIASFVSKRMRFEHIPAVRTSDSALMVVEDLIAGELNALLETDEYRQAIEKLDEIEKPALEKLAQSVGDTLRTFLPNVRNVAFESDIRSFPSFPRRSRYDIMVDDGIRTPLRLKGDGVQSLAALGIMRCASDRHGDDRNSVVAIEEPESHLHPAAIHALRLVLEDLAKKHQLVLTTHCPLFVERTQPSRNVIVSQNKARPARNIGEVREILGVHAADNLLHAELVLLVEGESDKIAIRALLADKSEKLRKAFENNVLTVQKLTGGGKLPYMASLILNSLCSVHCWLDNDECGRTAFEQAQKDGILDQRDVTFTNCRGKAESEIEDLYQKSVYEAKLTADYQISLSCDEFKSKKKWASRIHDVFHAQGKLWNDDIEKELKFKVAHLVAAAPSDSLHPRLRGPFDSLASTLVSRLTRS